MLSPAEEPTLQVAEEVVCFVIPSEARNLSWIEAQQEKFLASLGMTKI
jgi:hypothetical protein